MASCHSNFAAPSSFEVKESSVPSAPFNSLTRSASSLKDSNNWPAGRVDRSLNSFSNAVVKPSSLSLFSATNNSLTTVT